VAGARFLTACEVLDDVTLSEGGAGGLGVSLVCRCGGVRLRLHHDLECDSGPPKQSTGSTASVSMPVGWTLRAVAASIIIRLGVTQRQVPSIFCQDRTYPRVSPSVRRQVDGTSKGRREISSVEITTCGYKTCPRDHEAILPS
jgi:hypothetical protein